MKFYLYQSDNLDILRAMPDNCVDSIVTDPPYGISFMGKKWDYDVPTVELWKECLRVLKPGGHLLAFAGTRTQHRMACRIEDAGFEIRDMIAWTYGSGFSKSLNISKAIDKAAGAEREKILVPTKPGNTRGNRGNTYATDTHAGFTDISAPATDAAKQWNGWGTGLKPAHEPVGVYYKPLTMETVFAILLADVTEQIWSELCQRSNVSVSDAENLLSGIRARLEKAAAFSVAENARINVMEKTESAILAAPSFISQDRTEEGRDITKADFVLESANPNGSASDTLATKTQAGWEGGMSMVGTFISAIMDDTSENIALLWSNTLAEVLNQASTFTTRTALRLTTELRTLKSLVRASTSQNTGSSSTYSPSLEPITLARKPISEKTIAENVLKWGTGGINIDGCRVGVTSEDKDSWKRLAGYNTTARYSGRVYKNGKIGSTDDRSGFDTSGRWPANLIHDGSDEVVGLFPHTGASKGRKFRAGDNIFCHETYGKFVADEDKYGGYDDAGSAARYFYCPKASKSDRDEGLDGFEEKKRFAGGIEGGSIPLKGSPPPLSRNVHATVKPTDLMRYLCRLVTPPGGIVLDPFMGSGSTGKAAILEGFSFIGMEKEPEYVDIARARIEFAAKSVSEKQVAGSADV